MNINRKKELVAEYMNRKPEMGILSIKCTVTNDVFLLTSRDTQAGINSERFKLNADMHGNRELQALWQTHGSDSFEWNTVEILDYQNTDVDYDSELLSLLDLCLAENPQAKRAYRNRKL